MPFFCLSISCVTLEGRSTPLTTCVLPASENHLSAMNPLPAPQTTMSDGRPKPKTATDCENIYYLPRAKRTPGRRNQSQKTPQWRQSSAQKAT